MRITRKVTSEEMKKNENYKWRKKKRKKEKLIREWVERNKREGRNRGMKWKGTENVKGGEKVGYKIKLGKG